MVANLTSRQAVLNQLELIIFDGGSLDDAQANLRETLDDQDRRFASHMLMVCLRRYFQSEKIIAAHVTKPFKKKYRLAQLVLHMGITQLLWMETPDHAAIHTAVSLAKKNDLSHQSGLVNAVLKKIASGGEGKSSALDTIPKWLRQSWEKSYGADAVKQMANVQVQEPPLDIVVKGDAKGWAEKLDAKLLVGNTLRGASGAVTKLDGFDAGEWWVQDVSASLPVQLLGDVKGKRVLDLCAAPGGKTAQLAAAGARVTALDRSEKRLERLHENMARLQLHVDVVAEDALEWDPILPFDVILLDAPCSATGTIRRHPDLMLHKTLDDVHEMVAIQTDMVEAAMEWLAQGGILLYCTCSLQREEGEGQVESFLQAHSGWRVLPFEPLPNMPAEWITKHGWLRTVPHYLGDQGGMDGFFAAQLIRKG